ncbi:fibronectin type III domain-containing protein [Blastococcus sp. PRF04-17]|uniref:fibronectin type III domain-containing protein n=1 Tax=Blastococcus sp. PRF04-17 TaxID=2933797 RepID=UPI001FF581DA|nr:fibronectin type III domain-containing protein [Blastococcus sp. PRF04-17]UOY03809.1 fibronectin type III domain-containing protein [Blastococcus sp. PRF04-17]
MQRSDQGGRARRRSWLPRALALLVVAGTVAVSGHAPLATPALRTASATDPAPPTDVVAASADRALHVSWTAPAGETVTGYRVRLDGVLVASPTGTSVTLAGLVNGRSYVVTVITRSSFLGLPTEGTTASVPVTGTPRDAVPPAAPAGVTAVRGDGKVDLSWVLNATDYDADGYRVLRDGVPITGRLGAATTSYTDTTVVNDVTYGYAVQTHDTSDNWSASSTPAASATPTDLTPPATPTGIMVGRGDGSAGLAWDPNAEPDLAHYLVLRDGVEVATVTDTDHLDLGLTNDTTYSYALVAVDTHGNRSAPTAPVSVTPTDLTPPAAPTGLVAVRGDGQVVLGWDANGEPDLAGYRLLRDGVEVAIVTGATSYTDTGLTNDVEYRYTLAAIDNHGNHSISSSPAYATPTDLGAPAMPTGLTATPADGQVTLSWAANTEPDLAGYVVLRDGADVATVSTPGYADTGVTNGTTYGYSVVAVDTHGNRSPSTSAVAATPVDVSAPASPAGLVATRGDGQVFLTWTANGEPDLATYRVLRDGVEIVSTAGTSFTDLPLVNDVTYSYALVAVDRSGNRSAPSSPVPATPTDLTAPAAPTGLSAVKVSGRTVVSWTANGEPDLASYRVFRDGVEIATVTGTSYTDNQVTGAARTYALVAVDTHGNRSAASAPVSTAADFTPPAVPTGLTATRGDERVTLSWARNNEADFATYRVLRDGVEIATVTTRSYVDTGLTNDVTYSYSLVAVDDVGNRSAASAPVSATPTDLTPPAAPTGLVAVAGENEVSLAWAANGEADLADYRVLRDGVEIATVPTRTYLDTGLTNDVAYAYTLVAVDTHGNRSAPSAVASATPRDMAPDAPTDVTAVPGDRRAVLSWTAPSDTDVVGYRVLAEDGRIVATVAAPATRAAVPDLVNGTTYRFTVAAVDAGGTSPGRRRS